MEIQTSYALPVNLPSIVEASKVMGKDLYQGIDISGEGQLELSLRRKMILEELQNGDHQCTMSGVDLIGLLLDLKA